MNVVFSLGGSLVVPDEIDTEYLSALKELLLSYDFNFFIVVGGGRTARKYIEAAGNISEITNEQKDLIGIQATQLNAELVLQILGDVCYEKVVYDPKKKIETDKKVVVASGNLPGYSSDMDAVFFAETEDIETVVNLTNVDYVYDKNPSEEGAQPIKKLTFDEYKEIVGTEWKSGMHAPFDPIAAQEAAKHAKKIVVLNGNNLDNLRNFLDGKEFEGSIIQNN